MSQLYDGDRVSPASGSSVSSRPSSVVRRDSLQQLVRPADDPTEAATHPTPLAAHQQPDDDSPAALAARSMAGSPIPGAVDSSTASTSSKRRPAPTGRTSSTLLTPPKYTTTLEEDEARDRAEAAEREAASREADQSMQSFSKRSVGSLLPRHSSASTLGIARRASFVDDPRSPATDETALLPSQVPSDGDMIEPIQRRASGSGGDAMDPPHSQELMGRQRRKYHPDEVDAVTRPTPSPKPNQPDDDDDSHPADVAVGSADTAAVAADHIRGNSRSASRPASASASRSQSRRSAPHSPGSAHGEEIPIEEEEEAQQQQQQEHQPEEQPEPAEPEAKSQPEEPNADAPVEAEPDADVVASPSFGRPDDAADVDVDVDGPLPVFSRAPRQYHSIADPAAELDRIRAEKDFEPEFDDLILPSFFSKSGAPGSNPLSATYQSVHDLVSAEVAAPIPSVDESTLLDELLGVGKLSLDEVAQIESELEQDRLEELQKELQRATRRELELATLQHALLQAHSETDDVHKKELLEKEHQLLQSSRLLMKEEQESFRRAEDGMRSWLRRHKNATLHVHMQDLVDAADPNKSSALGASNASVEPKEKELKERGSEPTKANATSAEEEKLEASRQEIQDLYARVRSRKYDIKWNYEPRLVRFRLDWIRCLKNKLPLGNYNLMITLYDRLGGDALRWSTSAVEGMSTPSSAMPGAGSTCFSHAGSTSVAQRHNGKFHNLELTFNQKANRVFIACPSMILSRPSMVFIFELFLMGDASPKPIAEKRGSILDFAGKGVALAQEMLLKARDPKQYALLKAAQANAAKQSLQRAPPSSDRVVAWGAFPMAYINFDIIKGQFKVPLLRGAYGDEPIEKFQTIHEKIASNLDNWLANLYFDVRHWPRLLDHAVENSVELNFKGKKVGQEEESSDEEEEEEENAIIAADGALIQQGDGPSSDSLLLDGLEPDILVLDDNSSGALAGSAPSGGSSAPQNSQRNPRVHDADRRVHDQSQHAIDLTSDTAGAAPTNSTKKKNNKKGASSTAQHEATTTTERRMKIKLQTRKYPGMLLDIPDMDQQTVAELRNQKKRAELCAKYRYNVNLSDGTEGGDEEGTASQANNPLGRRAAYKMRYIANEVWADLGIRRMRDWEFFFFFIVVSLWSRIFTHYLGQYLFLSSIYVPIIKFDCKLYTCDITYVWDPLSVTAQTQIGVMVMGVITNMIIFATMIWIVDMIQRVFGRAPQWVARLVLAWGCGTILEPLLIIIIDCAQHNWYGDSFKLYQYYLAKDGNGIAGIFMTILFTLMLVVCSIVEFYFYVIKIHMNGRILDVHYRLHGDASLFHIPHDLEVSVRELRWLLIKARRWVGMGGQKRKITVSKFRVRDPLRPAAKQDISIYVAIYTQSLNGDIELFRHFLRSPSGAIVELFDTIDITGEDSFRRIEDKLASHEKRLAASAAATGTGTGTPGTMQSITIGDFATKLHGLSTAASIAHKKGALAMSLAMGGTHRPAAGSGSGSAKSLTLQPPNTPTISGQPGNLKGRLKPISLGISKATLPTR